MLIKRLVLLLLVFVGRAAAYGQSSYYVPAPKIFNGGIILGTNLSQVDGDSYYGYHKVGLNAGGIVCVHFSKTVGVSLELLYSQKGSRGEAVLNSYAIGTYIESYHMNLNYVEAPLMLHLFQDRFEFEAGFSYAYLVRSSEWVQADVPVVIDPVLNKFSNTDLDYVIGASRRMYKKLYLNARFEYSAFTIRPADRIPVGYGYGSKGQYNNLVNLRLVYYL